MTKIVEAGEFEIMVGTASDNVQSVKFSVVD
jgi:hypothetical protein